MACETWKSPQRPSALSTSCFKERKLEPSEGTCLSKDAWWECRPGMRRGLVIKSCILLHTGCLHHFLFQVFLKCSAVHIILSPMWKRDLLHMVIKHFVCVWIYSWLLSDKLNDEYKNRCTLRCITWRTGTIFFHLRWIYKICILDNSIWQWFLPFENHSNKGISCPKSHHWDWESSI